MRGFARTPTRSAERHWAGHEQHARDREQNGGTDPPARPLIPDGLDDGRGRHDPFLAQLGISEAEVGNCVSSQSAAGQPVSENDGRGLSDSRNLVPYSIAAYLSQPGVRGQTILRNLDRIVPTVPNT